MIGCSLLFFRAPCVRVIPLAVMGYVSTLPRAPVRALFNGNGLDTHSRKYLSSFSLWLSSVVGFTLTVKLTI